MSVLDPLSAQKNAAISLGSNLLHPPSILLEVPNKCLSPITEVPTPSPSPAVTPIMPRHEICPREANLHLLVPPSFSSRVSTNLDVLKFTQYSIKLLTFKLQSESLLRIYFIY